MCSGGMESDTVIMFMLELKRKALKKAVSKEEFEAILEEFKVAPEVTLKINKNRLFLRTSILKSSWEWLLLLLS